MSFFGFYQKEDKIIKSIVISNLSERREEMMMRRGEGKVKASDSILLSFISLHKKKWNFMM